MSEPTTARITPTTVVVDRPRHLFVDLNALAEAEERTGKNLLSAASWLTLGFKDWKTIIWACLLRHDPGLTLEEVGAMVHPGNIQDVQEKVLEAVVGAWPAKKENKEGEGAQEDPTQPPPT